MTTTNDLRDGDLGDDLVITRVSRQAAGTGTWVRGRLNGHRFEALLLPAHAENPAWELAGSRIAKLWVQRLADRRKVFTSDQGADVAAADRSAFRPPRVRTSVKHGATSSPRTARARGSRAVGLAGIIHLPRRGAADLASWNVARVTHLSPARKHAALLSSSGGCLLI